MGTIEYCCHKKPLIDTESCGDTYLVLSHKEKVFIAIIDVLGHGKEARNLAIICEEFLKQHYDTPPLPLIKDLNEHIKGSRGIVASLGQLDTNSGIFHYVLIGDITIKKFGNHQKTAVSRPGIIGYMMPTPIQEEIILEPGDVMLFHTDGVMNHFHLSDYPCLLSDPINEIAKHVIQKFGKSHDDAACIAVRYSA